MESAAAAPTQPMQPQAEDTEHMDASNEPVDPHLESQLHSSASRALESGAAAALSHAQQQARAMQEREAAEDAAEAAREANFDFGEDFGIGSTKGAPSEPPTQPGRTFLTGVDNASQASLSQHQQQTQSVQAQEQQVDPDMRMSDEELIAHVEQQMLEYERSAQYLEAEKARQHLSSLKARFTSRRRHELDRVQAEDVKVFFAMVAQHQQNFDATWAKKALEHKLRADDLIDALKWKHESQQRELYETLRRKRMPKFSVELLNMRKRQVLLAKAKNYLSAEKIKRKADILEAIEIERIREQAKEENQLRFQSLLAKQEWDRRQLSAKLKLEKKALLEAKSQDFLRLKKRLRNAEQELKKTHVRQQLLAERKLAPLHAFDAPPPPMEQSKRPAASSRGTVLRNTGMQRMMGSSGSGSGSSTARHSAAAAAHNQPPMHAPMRSARELARSARDSASGRAGASIMGGGGQRPSSRLREEKDQY